MLTAAMVLAVLAAALHVLIFYMESIAWEGPLARKTFGGTPEEARPHAFYAFNQGFYNLFLALQALTGVALAALGHVELDGFDAETRAASSIKEKEKLSYKEWAVRLQRYYSHIEMLFSPDLFVVGDRIFLACAGGRGIALDGAGVTWGSFQRRQERLVARCEAIWLWGVAHGATRESGRYVPVRDESMQREREILEKGMGLAVPRRG